MRIFVLFNNQNNYIMKNNSIVIEKTEAAIQAMELIKSRNAIEIGEGVDSLLEIIEAEREGVTYQGYGQITEGKGNDWYTFETAEYSGNLIAVYFQAEVNI